ncbi:MAG: type II toxin-antitoxin system RelE/ParE family toxin [Gemmatimonadetes bacterium]|nr:type II toxin-antitoxin system RelE/ParE family toxin [Gemmatimonadota bacterium]
MEEASKPVFWVGSVLRDIRRFPDVVRSRLGFELYQVQLGLQPSDWKPMPSVGPGVLELRIHTGEEYRVFCVAAWEEGVYVLHAFGKKTARTSGRDLELGRARYAMAKRNRAGSRRQP